MIVMLILEKFKVNAENRTTIRRGVEQLHCLGCKHDVRDKVWDDREQQFKAQNQMEWFLKEVRVQQ